MEHIEIRETKKRLDFLNIYKALLVLGMITGHALMLLSNSKGEYILYYKTYINLITFSGFFLAFGYIYEMIYFQKGIIFKKNLMSVFKLLLAFYISGIFFRMLIKPHAISWPVIAKILILSDVPGYSEFLLAFAIIALLALLFAKLPDKIKLNTKVIIVLCLMALVSAFFIKKGESSTYLGLLMGSNKFGAFPVLQYSFWFWIGVLIRRDALKLNWKIMLVCILMTMTYLGYYINENRFPSRFPPSFLWIIGSAFPLYLLLKISIYFEQIKGKLPVHLYQEVNLIGENTLFHLIMSNIFLFILSNYIYVSAGWAFIIGCLVIMTNGYLVSMIRK